MAWDVRQSEGKCVTDTRVILWRRALDKRINCWSKSGDKVLKEMSIGSDEAQRVKEDREWVSDEKEKRSMRLGNTERLMDTAGNG